MRVLALCLNAIQCAVDHKPTSVRGWVMSRVKKRSSSFKEEMPVEAARKFKPRFHRGMVIGAAVYDNEASEEESTVLLCEDKAGRL